ncbi:FKBP-type peptidyl-prolyl cis-trans isomerase [Pseudomonas aeruginosa]|nr:FKBP-type peptidyl-prolyl cis-trans isomerase [Pseudomonas aeruginosa]
MKGALITTQYKGHPGRRHAVRLLLRARPAIPVRDRHRTSDQGWDQGLMGMKVGGKRRLFVPSHLAYGERQVGAHIKPHSNLLFEIELLEVLTRDD